MPRTANKFPITIAVPLEKWMAAAIQEAAFANDRTPEQEIRARLREGLEPPAVERERHDTPEMEANMRELMKNGPAAKLSLGD